MHVLYLVLFMLSAGCFLLEALSVRTVRVHLIALGLFFWALVPLIQTLRTLN